jgi:UDPglucose 6-dehydrogenase/GDP-mannose 6-dehydrogenase
MAEPLSISVVGTGYVGLVSGTCLAAKGHAVRVLDLRPDVVATINRGIPPIHEAGLSQLLADVVSRGRLVAAAACHEAIGDADLVLLCVGTPSHDGAIDLGQIRSAAAMVGRWLRDRERFAAVVVKSTVVPGTTDTVVREVLEAESGRRVSAGQFGLGMNPEFLREGEAVEDFMHPDRIVFGHEDDGTLDLLRRMYAPWNCEKIAVNSRTAEMIKYANNCMLALQISAVNELANVAAAVGGIDFMHVVRGVAADKRWNPPQAEGRRANPAILSYLVPGCGFGGSCFPKDVEAMRTLASSAGIEPRVLQAVLDVNAAQPVSVLRPFLAAFGEDPRGRSVLLLGLAFKPGTDDVRESASLVMARYLADLGVRVLAHDPIAAANAVAALGPGVVELVDDWQAAISVADGVVLATRWPEYEALATTPTLLESKVFLDARRMFAPGIFPRARHIAVGYTPATDQPTARKATT